MNYFVQQRQRDELHKASRELIDGADAILREAERAARELTTEEARRFESILQRARRLRRKAEADDMADSEQDGSSAAGRSVLFRSIVALVKAGGNHRAAMVAAREAGDPEAALVLRAASTGATTGTAGWAAELVTTLLGDIIPLLQPRSVLFALAADAFLPLGGTLRLPRRATGAASGFVAEGAAIPVRQWSLDGIDVVPYKAAGIVVATAELFERADRFAESFVMGSLSDDIALGVDQVFLSSNAATAAAPAGLFHASNAAASIAPTTGGTSAACATDLANLLAAGASFVRPTLLIHPQTIAKALALSGSSSFSIIQALATGRIGRVEVLEAGNIATSTLALVDREGLVVAGGEGFELSVSSAAALHMDDGPNADLAVPASGVHSLFQTDSVATLVKLPVTWRSRRVAQVQRIENATWA